MLGTTILPICVAAMLLIFLFMAGPAYAVDLTDIDGHWGEDDIRELVALGAIHGYPDGTYRPEHTITRAEFCSVIFGALDLTQVEGHTFPDTAGHWGEGRIEALVRNEVINIVLYGDTYGPEGEITREEIAMMTVRMLGEATGVTAIPFDDAGEVTSGYHSYVAEAYGREIILGYPDGTFRPGGSATRAEAAAMAMRVLRLLPDDPDPEPDPVTLDAIEVTLADDALGIGEATQATALALYSDASSADVTDEAEWSSSDEGVASVSAAGMVEAIAVGDADILAEYGGETDSATVLVEDRPTIENISVFQGRTGAFAKLTTGAHPDDPATGEILWVASRIGTASNDIEVELYNAGAGKSLRVDVIDTRVTVQLETAGDGTVISTATEVAEAVNAHADAGGLLTAEARNAYVVREEEGSLSGGQTIQLNVRWSADVDLVGDEHYFLLNGVPAATIIRLWGMDHAVYPVWNNVELHPVDDGDEFTIETGALADESTGVPSGGSVWRYDGTVWTKQ